MREFIENRLQEGSTLRGLLWVLASFGIIHFSTDQRDAIVALAMALGGAGGILAPDRLFGKSVPDRRKPHP